jgi:hypothetical protein
MEDIEVYDYVQVHTLEDGDQIAITNDEGGTDYLENITVVSDPEAVLIKGYSHLTGDNAVYVRPFDEEVGLWSV